MRSSPRSSSLPAFPRHCPEHALGHQADQLRRGDGGASGHGIEGLERTEAPRRHEVAGDLDGVADDERERADVRGAQLAGDPAGRVQIGALEHQVVGDEDPPCPDAAGPGGRVWRDRSGVGSQVRKGPPAHLGERALGAVAERRDAEHLGHVPDELLPRPEGLLERHLGELVGAGPGHERDERDHVDDAEPGVDALVRRQVEQLDGACRDRAGWRLRSPARRGSARSGCARRRCARRAATCRPRGRSRPRRRGGCLR